MRKDEHSAAPVVQDFSGLIELEDRIEFGICARCSDESGDAAAFDDPDVIILADRHGRDRTLCAALRPLVPARNHAIRIRRRVYRRARRDRGFLPNRSPRCAAALTADSRIAATNQAVFLLIFSFHSLHPCIQGRTILCPRDRTHMQGRGDRCRRRLSGSRLAVLPPSDKSSCLFLECSNRVL